MKKHIRKKAFRFVAILIASVLTGCAAQPKSTGVMTIAPDTYRIAARGAMGVSADSRNIALSQADQFCGSLNRAMQVVETGKAPLTGPYELTFKCPANDDPEAVSDVKKKLPSEIPAIK